MKSAEKIILTTYIQKSATLICTILMFVIFWDGGVAISCYILKFCLIVSCVGFHFLPLTFSCLFPLHLCFIFLISPIYLNLCFSITLCQFCFVICLCSCSISLHLSWFLRSPCFFGCYPPLLPFMCSSPSLPHLASSLLSPHLFLVLSLVSVFSLCVSFTPYLVIVFVCPCSCPLFGMFWFWVFHVMQQQRRATKQPGGE